MIRERFGDLGRDHETTGNRGAAGHGHRAGYFGGHGDACRRGDERRETFRGTIVTSGVSGTRTVISSVIVAKGVSNGVGRIVETDSLATDPPGSSRDDLVFPGGTIHIISTIVDFSFTINPNCLGRATIRQSGEVQRGTGQFAHAAGTFNGTVRPGGATMAQREASEVVVRYATTVWACA